MGKYAPGKGMLRDSLNVIIKGKNKYEDLDTNGDKNNRWYKLFLAVFFFYILDA